MKNIIFPNIEYAILYIFFHGFEIQIFEERVLIKIQQNESKHFGKIKLNEILEIFSLILPKEWYRLKIFVYIGPAYVHLP